MEAQQDFKELLALFNAHMGWSDIGKRNGYINARQNHLSGVYIFVEIASIQSAVIWQE